MNRVRRSYRLPPEIVELIDALSVVCGIDRTAVVESAIRSQAAFLREITVINENDLYESLRVDCPHRLNGTGPLTGCPACERLIREAYIEPRYDGRAWYIDSYQLAD